MKRAILCFMFAFTCMVFVNAQTDNSKRKPKQVTVQSSGQKKRPASTSTSQKNIGDVNKTSSSNEDSSQSTSNDSHSNNTNNVKGATRFNGHEYVDLGLSVKWATCNIGASNPEDSGDYYAWGETGTKSTYDWSTYKWCSNGSWTGMTKYTCPDNLTDGIWYINSTFVGDNKTTLAPEDDVAHVKLGGTWRMPTKAEQDELRDKNNCTWTWTTQDGVNGYKVTSKKNGNSIFLPASGYRYDSSLYGAGSYGRYWSSSLNTSSSYYAYVLGFDSGGVSSNRNGRGCGQSVRPVCP